MMYRTFFVISFLFVTVYSDLSYVWNYGEYGPDVWSEMYPTCGGQSQSPINILTACTTYKQFQPFVLASGYDEQHNFTLTNNGHTIVGTFNNESKLSAFRLTGGSLNGTFEFQNFHLHWGQNHKSGSEHEV
jgi:carbonic anhydrase